MNLQKIDPQANAIVSELRLILMLVALFIISFTIDI